ncbi:MAG: hypothetical protein ACYCUX_01580 [Metallibacterium sp.]
MQRLLHARRCGAWLLRSLVLRGVFEPWLDRLSFERRLGFFGTKIATSMRCAATGIVREGVRAAEENRAFVL